MEDRAKARAEKGADSNRASCSRRRFMAAALAPPVALAAPVALARARSRFRESSGLGTPSRPASAVRDSAEIISPSGNLKFQLAWRHSPSLTYRITIAGHPIIETSQLGMIVDNVDLGRGAHVIRTTSYRVNESYTWRGVHSKAINRSSGAKISVEHRESKTSYSVEVRVFDDGVAFRHVIPGDGR